MAAYYNENDEHAADQLERLIAAKLIAAGDVDRRSIKDVLPDDLKGYSQHHFFAGYGGWPYALRLAGWNDRPAWTASCPCQPYSVASVGTGGAQGQGDERDLWPDFFRLARERGAATIFGEQVGAAIGWGWWDRAAMDLESAAYSVASAVLRADAYGGQHERKRLYWVADAGRERRQGHQPIRHVPRCETAALAEYDDTVARARRALDGDFSHLLPSDGLSVVMERHALKGYGNALYIGAAVEFIKAFTETLD